MPKKKTSKNTLQCNKKKKPAMSKPSLDTKKSSLVELEDIEKDTSPNTESLVKIYTEPSITVEEPKNMIDIKLPKLLNEDKQEELKRDAFKSEVKRFIEVSKYFSSPLTKTASYMCEDSLISYPSQYFLEYKRGGITTFHIKFTNIKLEAVYLKLYKLIPHLEEIKYINLSLSRCKRIPPGLSFSLGFVYDDANDRPAQDAKLIFMASRKSTTPCYQVCEIDFKIHREFRKITI